MSVLVWSPRSILDRLQSTFGIPEAPLTERNHRCGPVGVRKRKFKIERVNVVQEQRKVRLRFLVVRAKCQRVRGRVSKRRSGARVIDTREAVYSLFESERRSQSFGEAASIKRGRRVPQQM